MNIHQTGLELRVYRYDMILYWSLLVRFASPDNSIHDSPSKETLTPCHFPPASFVFPQDRRLQRAPRPFLSESYICANTVQPTLKCPYFTFPTREAWESAASFCSACFGIAHNVAYRPVAGQRPRDKQKMQQQSLSNCFAKKHICTATIGNSNRKTMFSTRSVKRCYKQDGAMN